MSIATFSSVAHVLEQGYDSVAEVSLDSYFSIFCTAADSASDLKRASKLGKVIRCAHKTGYERNLLSYTTFSVDGYNEVLL